MADATCGTCPFYSSLGPHTWGNCRRVPAVWTDQGEGWEQPIMKPDEWCGEHPLRQRDRIAAAVLPALVQVVAGTDVRGFAAYGVNVADALKQQPGIAYLIADAMLAVRERELTPPAAPQES